MPWRRSPRRSPNYHVILAPIAPRIGIAKAMAQITPHWDPLSAQNPPNSRLRPRARKRRPYLLVNDRALDHHPANKDVWTPLGFTTTNQLRQDLAGWAIQNRKDRHRGTRRIARYRNPDRLECLYLRRTIAQRKPSRKHHPRSSTYGRIGLRIKKYYIPYCLLSHYLRAPFPLGMPNVSPMNLPKKKPEIGRK